MRIIQKENQQVYKYVQPCISTKKNYIVYVIVSSRLAYGNIAS